MHKYNTYFPAPETNPTAETLAAERGEMLKGVLGKVDSAVIEPPFLIDYGCNIFLGKRFFANFNLTILDCGIVTIGGMCF